jgi:hypothetical protein
LPDHLRKQLRLAAVSILQAAVPGATVEASRMYPVDETEMPKIIVYMMIEKIDPSSSTRDGMSRIVDMIVETIVNTNAGDIDDILDGYAVLIEPVLNTSRLNGLANRVTLTNSTMVMDEKEALQAGILTLTFAVEYRTNQTNPTVKA